MEANYSVSHFVLVDDICVLSIFLLKRYRWKKFLTIPCKTNENWSKSRVFPPWATLSCFHKEREHQFIDVFLYPPSNFHIYSLLTFFLFYLLLVNTVLGAKPKLWDHHNHTSTCTQEGGKGVTDSAFLQKPYRWSLGLTAHSLSLKNFQTTVHGICPSEPKQASLLLTQPLPINLKTRVSLSFYFVFQRFLQGAITLYW